MGRSARWLGVILLGAGTACGSSSGRPGGEHASGGAGGADTGGTAGSSASAGAGAFAAGASGAGAVASGGTAGSAGNAGAGAATGGNGSAGADAGAAGVAAESCPVAPAPRLTSGTPIELPIELTFSGAPLLFAEDNPVPSGGTLTPLGVRFYISEVALLREGGEPVPVDIVTSSATVAPYGVHFFNADDAASTTLRLLAPAGEYEGITFLWGLAQPCNTRTPESSAAPLSATSEMTWPHTGFLFFRYEGRTLFPGTGSAGAAGAGAGGAGTSSGGAAGTSARGTGAGEGGAGGASAGTGGDAAANAGSAGNPASLYPSVIHMGGNLFEPLAPVIRLNTPLSVTATGPIQKRLRVAVDEIFEGARADIDLADFVGPPGEEVLAGERLRRSLPTLSVFSLEP